MKHFHFKMVALLFTAISVCSLKAQTEFITKWVTNGSSISFPGAGSNYTISWEEEGVPTHNGSTTVTYNNIWNPVVISFGSAGTYIVKVTGGLNEINSAAISANKNDLKEIMQWGNIAWTALENAFYQCSNVDVTANDVPDLSNVKSIRQMFKDCTALKGNSSFNNWNTAAIENMVGVFNNDINFNQDISAWNTSNVTNTGWMFQGATAFNQNIAKWDVSKVTDMSSMFDYAQSFNQNLGSWNLSSLKTAYAMFIADPNTGMSCENYSATLAGWAAATSTPNSVDFRAQTNRIYNASAQTARNTLATVKNWQISDDSYVANCSAVPVSFGDFSAIINGDNLVVTWYTFSEKNNKEFVIEVSDNGIDNWKKVHTIQSKAANGNSNEKIDYTSTLPLAGTSLLAAVSLLAIGFLPNRRNRLFATLFAVILGVVLFSCNKTDVNNTPGNSKKVYVRLSQIDKDGTVKILGIKEVVRK